MVVCAAIINISILYQYIKLFHIMSRVVCRDEPNENYHLWDGQRVTQNGGEGGDDMQ